MKDVVDQRLRALRQIGSEARQLLRDRLLAPFRSAHPSPVVVLGFQKSGTSAIAGLLGRATGLPTTIDFVGARSPYIDALRSGAEPFESFVRKNALAFSRPIVKEPNLSVFIPQIVEAFDRPKIVFVVREPASNVKSILDRLKLDPRRLPKSGGWVPPNRTWAEMVGHAKGGDWDPVESLTRQWVQVNRHAVQHLEDLMLIRYEDFLSDKVGTVERAVAALGMDRVHDIASMVDHQFQPAGNRARKIADVFSETQMDMINQMTADVRCELGY